MDTINSLLNDAECNDLFSNDELDGLYHAISSSAKREYPNMIVEPKKLFNTRVKKNLHICLTLAPDGPNFKMILNHYNGLLTNTQIYWLRDWTKEYLLAEAEYFMQNRLNPGDIRDKLAKCMSEIHSYMLQECRQVPWSGFEEFNLNSSEEFTWRSASVASTITEKKKKNERILPYSKSILHELIKQVFLLFIYLFTQNCKI